MKNKINRLITHILLCSFMWIQAVHAQGSTVITIDAEDEISENLLYAIDSIENFSEENVFEVESGSTHKVYVKDETGNITEQTVVVPEESESITIASQEDPEDNEDTDYSTAPDSGYEREYAAAEDGGGTVADNTVTLGNSSDEGKQFLTVTTKNDHVFYIVIDNASSSNNVYLLDQVTDTDLIDLIAEEDEKRAEEIAEMQKAGNPEDGAEEEIQITEKPEKRKKTSGMAGKLLILLLAGGGAGAYMYFKKKKGEKYDEDELDEDAADLKENFEVIDDDEAEDADEDVFYEDIDIIDLGEEEEESDGDYEETEPEPEYGDYDYDDGLEDDDGLE